jgi:hypothetical protein
MQRICCKLETRSESASCVSIWLDLLTQLNWWRGNVTQKGQSNVTQKGQSIVCQKETSHGSGIQWDAVVAGAFIQALDSREIQTSLHWKPDRTVADIQCIAG